MENRFRLVMGETHNDVMIADDLKKEYMRSPYPVDLLNEYENKLTAVKEYLDECNLVLCFIYLTEDNAGNNILKISNAPRVNDDGDWRVISVEQFNEIKKELKNGWTRENIQKVKP